jgi:hypothetical protein
MGVASSMGCMLMVAFACALAFKIVVDYKMD